MPARRILLESVIAADRARRRAHVWARAARVLPWTGAVAAAASLAALLIGRARPIGAVVLAAGLSAAGALILSARRRRTPPDSVIATIDAAADLGGALRSAHWFASRGPDTPPAVHDPAWVAHHLDTTAARVANIDWASVFPPPRAARAWQMTALFGAAALALIAIDSPHRPAPAQARDETPADTLILVPPHLSGDVMTGVNALTAGQQPPKETLAAVGQALEIAKKDPQARRELEALFAQTGMPEGNFDGGWLTDHDWDVNELPWADATGGIEWAYQAARSRAALEETPASFPDPAPSAGHEQSGRTGTPDRGRRPGSPPDGPPVRADTRGQPGSFASLLFGRQQAKDDAGGTAPRAAGASSSNLTAALRREVVHAQQDASDLFRPGAPRRHAGPADAADSPRGVAPTGVRYDASAAGRPPAVPEARQALLHDFFARPATDAAAPQPR